MDGKKLVDILNVELKKQKISKGDFYNAIGISPTAFYGWKNGAEPKRDKIEAIEKYLGISLSDIEGETEEENESNQLREMLRDRQDLRILLESARDVPPSSVYALIAQIEKQKENSVGLPD